MSHPEIELKVADVSSEIFIFRVSFLFLSMTIFEYFETQFHVIRSRFDLMQFFAYIRFS